MLKRVLRVGEASQNQTLERVASQTTRSAKFYEDLTDYELSLATEHFLECVAKGESRETLIPEAFAAAGEAIFRTLGFRPHQTQIMGAAGLTKNCMVQMNTGEGKTVTVTMAAYAQSLFGPVHVITANPYLAERDADITRSVLSKLGETTVSFNSDNLSLSEKQEAHQCNITYGTISSFGFDYLRDNLASTPRNVVTSEHVNTVLVDEADLILIDEARTPMIISGNPKENPHDLAGIANSVRALKRDTHYIVDEKNETVVLTEEGETVVEENLSIDNMYTETNGHNIHLINNALRAHTLLQRGKDYAVRKGEIVIIDSSTGRLLDGRRFNGGLHQALEAKEHLVIQPENATLGSITVKNFLTSQYDNIAGLTGTALQVASEIWDAYQIHTLVIPPHSPSVRKDHPDIFFKTRDAKIDAIVERTTQAREKGQPVLIGTTSVTQSEEISIKLTEAGIEHNVLNATNLSEEAKIVANAGQGRVVTVSTNMAGRGTDIALGGDRNQILVSMLAERGAADPNTPISPELEQLITEHIYKTCNEERIDVLEAGGLLVIGTEKHSSARIDNQLRGRAGRQGDPGETQYFLSAQDELVKTYSPLDAEFLFEELPDSSEPLKNSYKIEKLFNQTQHTLEHEHRGGRKEASIYEDAVHKQTENLYKLRKSYLNGEVSMSNAIAVAQIVFEETIAPHVNGYPETWDLDAIAEAIDEHLPILSDKHPEDVVDEIGAVELLSDALIVSYYLEACSEYLDLLDLSNPQTAAALSRAAIKTIDEQWSKHLEDVEVVKDGVGLRAVSQKDPKLEFAHETVSLFNALLANLDKLILIEVMNLIENNLIAEEAKGAPAQN
jgi:preprotein translocase subunit SecA